MLARTGSRLRPFGFTLLELIVVIVVLGVLAAIAVPAFESVRQGSVDRALSTTADAFVTSATAIATSDGSGGVVSTQTMDTALGEMDLESSDISGVRDGTAVTFTLDGRDVVVVLVDGRLTTLSPLDGALLAYGPPTTFDRWTPTTFPPALSGAPLEGQVSYRLASGVLPDGVSFDPASGELTVTPSGLSRLQVVETGAAFDLGEASGAIQGAGANGIVTVVRSHPQLPAGAVLVAGGFSAINGVSAGGVAALAADGTPLPGFDVGTGASALVRAMVVQDDGRILVAGDFTSFDGVPRSRVARLEADGTLDLTFDPGVGPNARVLALVVDASGRVLIGGEFSSVSGQQRSMIARLTASGALDPGFDAGGTFTSFSFDSSFTTGVLALAVQPDGRILVGSHISSPSAGSLPPASSLARLETDGSVDTSFDPGFSLQIQHPLFGVVSGTPRVSSIHLASDGKVLVGGSFTDVDGVARGNVARILPDGSLDLTFGSGLSGADEHVSSVVVQGDGKVVVGGSFTAVDGVPRARLARLDASGALDATFDPGSGADGQVTSVLPSAGGSVFAVGDFTFLSGRERNRLAKVSAAGSVDLSFADFRNGGADGPVRRVLLQPDGRILLAGRFSRLVGSERSLLGRLGSDGTLDAGFADPSLQGTSSRFSGTTPPSLSALAMLPDGRILIGGSFSAAAGGTSHGVARLQPDGSFDSSFTVSAGDVTGVNVLRPLPSGGVLVGGSYVVRLTSSGSRDPSFAPPTLDTLVACTGSCPPDRIYDIELHPSGGMVMAGSWSSDVGGHPTQRVARLTDSGQVDTSFTTTVNGTVNDVVVRPDGSILAAGSFTSVNGTPASGLALLLPDGSLAVVAPPAVTGGAVAALAVQPDGRTVVVGSFTAVGGASRAGVARLLPDLTLDPGFAPDVSGTVSAVAVQDDGRVVIGGDFHAADGVPRNNVARIEERLTDVPFSAVLEAYSLSSGSRVSSGPVVFDVED